LFGYEINLHGTHAPYKEDTLAIQTEEEVSVAVAVINEAERCSREARAIIARDPKRYAALVGQPSGWCVVTEKGFWRRSFHAQQEESLLRERLAKGHRVILTIGIIADPRVPVTPENHVAMVSVNEECKLPWHKLALVTANAKLHAASAMFC
jgi:hypothetical protein